MNKYFESKFRKLLKISIPLTFLLSLENNFRETNGKFELKILANLK